MKEKILALLQNAKTYLSGQEISEKFGVSRTAVWKVIRQLENEGYEIDAVRNRGYRLRTVPDILTEERLQKCIQTDWAGNCVAMFEEIDSTNNEAKRKAEAGAGHGTLVVSEIQTAGKGRRGRNWVSAKGDGIWMSLILKPDIEPANASMLTLVMALAVVSAIRGLTGAKAEIKWPNDIVLNKKKVCGILTEMSAEPDLINHIVVGVGINVHNEKFPDDIQDKATSIFAETGNKITRAELIALTLKRFEHYYAQFCRFQDMTALLEEYNDQLVNTGREVAVLDPKQEYRGTARGINGRGELMVQTEDGMRNVASGEVSVRGIYGYV